MELKTTRQISLDYGISRRMLSYYEKIGLIKSRRMDDYAYRIYDESEIKRLQQIIILRKLQIPMKQIKDIINNQNAVAVIEVFEKNISELDEQITALSAVRSILARFVDELRDKADISLKLDLLNDTTMLAVVNSLSFSENRDKEKVSMGELNRANETLNKYADSKVRIVYIPPMTVVSASCANLNRAQHFNTELINANPHQRLSITMRDTLKKFIDDVGLFNIKPDTRIFGGGNESQNEEGHWEGYYDVWASIPDDLEVPAPLIKREFYGGLYAACAGHPGDLECGRILQEWFDNSDEYADDNGPGGMNRPACDEYFNAFNRYGMKHSYSEENGFSTFDALIPIIEIERLTEEQGKKVNVAWAKLNKSHARGKITDIDLTTMAKETENDARYENGLMILHRTESWNIGMITREQFEYPVKIEMRAKIDKEFMNLGFAQYLITLNWDGKNRLLIQSQTYGEHNNHKKLGKVAVNEFADIEWILGREAMAIKVNGELRYCGIDHGYIKAFAENSEYSMSGAVSVGTAFDNTLTVESLRVTEL